MVLSIGWLILVEPYADIIIFETQLSVSESKKEE